MTNALQYAPNFDHIIVLKNGKVAEEGSFSQLITKHTKSPRSNKSDNTTTPRTNTNTSTSANSNTVGMSENGLFYEMYQTCQESSRSSNKDTITLDTDIDSELNIDVLNSTIATAMTATATVESKEQTT